MNSEEEIATTIFRPKSSVKAVKFWNYATINALELLRFLAKASFPGKYNQKERLDVVSVKIEKVESK